MLFAHRRHACLSSVALLLALICTAARAQVDCSAGFNCGRLVYTERAPNNPDLIRILMQNLDGSQPTLVLEHQFGVGSSLGQFSFDAASRKIYFSLSPNTFGGPKIYVVNIDGSGLTNLTGDGCVNERFVISPDGAKMAFRKNCGSDLDGKVWLMDIDGSNPRLLTADPLVSSDASGNDHDNPSFSPDGSSVVFTSEATSTGSRQVYRSTLDGNSVLALTDSATDTRFNDDATYLPNGDIVFLSNRDATQDLRNNDLYRMDANGGSRLRLTNIVGAKQAVVVSPDGNHVLFFNRADTGNPLVLYVAKTDGTGAVDLFSESSESGQFSRQPRFSPDGTRVVFHLCIFIGNGDECLFVRRVMDVDGGNPVTYDDPALGIRTSTAFGRPDTDGDGVIDGADNCPAVRNGYTVAHQRAISVFTVNYDGSQLTALTLGTSLISDVGPRFDALGRRIVYSSNRNENNRDIYVRNPDASIVRLTNTPGIDREPAFSPDGSRIVFIGNRPQTPQYAIWSMNADGTDQRRLSEGGSFIGLNQYPLYSVDGSRIAFDSRRGNINNSNRDIFTIATDGSDERRLTTAAGDDLQAAYSRDGDSMVFISWRDGSSQNGEIYTMKSDGTDQRRLTNTTFRETEPTFSIDGAQIVFSANYHGTPDLYAINRDGTGLRRITAEPNGFLTNPTLAPQLDLDGDGIGDACEVPDNSLPTPVGSSVVVTSPGGSVSFSTVTTAGVTTFTPITVDPDGLPLGFSLCETCAAFDITSTAVYTPPLTVCLNVPEALSNDEFLALRLLHGESGVLVDRTSAHLPGPPRQVCGLVDSLSPFALATISRASSSALSTSLSPSRLGQATMFTVEVNGGISAPVAGSVVVEASSGESCATSTPVSTTAQRVQFACSISFQSYGERGVIALFSDSSSHEDSESNDLVHAVLRLVDVSVNIVSMNASVVGAEPIDYLVEVRNDGPDTAFGTALRVDIDPLLASQAWTCAPVGNAVCPVPSGNGNIEETLDLPPGGGVDVVVSGFWPANLPRAVLLTTDAINQTTSPDFVLDTAPINNEESFSSTLVGIFTDGFGE